MRKGTRQGENRKTGKIKGFEKGRDISRRFSTRDFGLTLKLDCANIYLLNECRSIRDWW